MFVCMYVHTVWCGGMVLVRGGGEVRRLDEIYRVHLFGDLYVLCTDM